MQEEQYINHQSPFDHGLFFPDSGRSSTLDALRNAVAGSASLITCIGDEGHGKTMLCKILEKDLPEPYIVISFPYSVESFDHVLQIIALKLNLDFSMEDNALGSDHILMEIAQVLRERGKRLLILFDEGEKLYLATLERVRKMIDLTNENGVLLQIVLFGRIGLQSHIEQLALCTFKNAQELHLSLPPLTEEDTFQYLNFCMQQTPGSEKKDIFSREVAAKILAMSHGNFRKINSLAGDSLRSSSYRADNTSFMVLLEHVRDSDDMVVGEPPASRLPGLLMQKKTILGAGALLIVLLLILLVKREEQKPATPSSIPASTQVTPHIKTQQIVTDKKNTITELVHPAPVTEAEPIAKTAPPAPVAMKEPVVQPAQPALQIAEVPSIKSGQPAPAVVEESSTKSVQPAPVTEEVPVAKSVQPSPAVADKPVTQPISVEIAPLVEKKSTDIQVVAADKLPKKNTIIPLLAPEHLTKNNKLKLTIAQQLPRKSFEAGQRWLAGEKNDHFTLQVMVLAADQARKKLQGIVREEEKQKGSGKFIVLQKSTSPATFILFYGEYPSLDAARNARNNLPPSLQKYTPYPLPVKQAVEKSKR
ncbi:MAG: AAA family ATPase [Proteobacteria bacterium]|nr:AAA family ATPase [Pseudomonadota bacterium]MBU1648710.1 AAA family ATPase [Pseudomonadota bacterium]